MTRVAVLTGRADATMLATSSSAVAPSAPFSRFARSVGQIEYAVNDLALQEKVRVGALVESRGYGTLSQMSRIEVLAPSTSAITAWLGSSKSDVEVVVFAADDAASVARAAELVAARPELRTIACLPDTSEDGVGADGAAAYAHVVADAYASDARMFAHALLHVNGEDRDDRATGPLRLTTLGALGMLQLVPRVGDTFPIAGERTTIGRGRTCEVYIPQGHSDQSNVARLHAQVTADADGILVRDCESTNGTYVCGVRVREARLALGEEIAVCGLLRMRLDGSR